MASSATLSRVRASALVAAAAVALLRVVAACSDDESAGPPPLLDDAGADGPNGSSTSPSRDGGGSPDAAPLPSFCDGIVFYASYDEGIEAEQGGGYARPGRGVIPVADAGIALDAGRFGGGAVLEPSGSASSILYDQDAGDAAPPASAFAYPLRVGSVAFWFKRTAPPPSSYLSFIRPYSSGGPSGAVISVSKGQLGIWRDLSNGPILIVRETSMRPFIRGADFDHYAFAWRSVGADAGTPIARLAINGGTGEVLFDAGADASSTPDASPDDAGNISTPYRAQRVGPFVMNELSLTRMRVGGTAATTPGGVIDDLVAWDRLLDFDEMEALYESSKAGSIRSVCKR